MRRFHVVVAFVAVAAAAPAQDLALARAAAGVDVAIPWITDGFFPTDPGRPVPLLPKTDVDRLALLDEAIGRAARENKLVFWYVPRIEGGHMVRPEFLDLYVRTLAFTDPWITKLVNARFVPLRMAVDAPTSKRTGITRLDWVEPAIVVLGPDGAMLHRTDRIRTFHPDWLRAALLRVLEEHAALAPVPVEVQRLVERALATPRSTILAAHHAALGAGFDAGAARIADDLVANGGDARTVAFGHYLRAVGLRFVRDRDGTAAALDRAAGHPGATPDLKGSVLTERGLLALNAGDPGHAAGLLADAAGLDENPRRGEALYLLALARLLGGDAGGAEDLFREVAVRYADDWENAPWAARAAANVLRGRDTTHAGPAFHGFEDPTWPDAAAFAESRRTTACSRPVGDAAAVARRAVEFLLRRQSSEGGFEDTRYAWCDSPRILPNVRVAITAAALAGLADWRDVAPERIDDAVRRGEEYLFDETNLARGRNEECYADAFRIVYLARRLPSLAQGSPGATRARERMRTVAKRLATQVSEDGAFAHEYPNPFATAAALVALKHAHDAGAAVPDGIFAKCKAMIRATRGPEGTFAYSAGRSTRRETAETFKNSMARMPLCEHALLIAESQPDPAPLAAALDNFWRQLPRFERIRTCDFHADGELGGFFFWHGMFFTSEAIEALPHAERGAHHRRMLAHVVSIAEIDGSFVDSHEVGKSYGTAMALMILRNSMTKGP